MLNPQVPIVGTGMEDVVAKDSRSAVVSKVSGKVIDVDSNTITIETESQPQELEMNPSEKYVSYSLKKFLRTNQNTCINQKPIVSLGQKLKKVI